MSQVKLKIQRCVEVLKKADLLGNKTFHTKACVHEHCFSHTKLFSFLGNYPSFGATCLYNIKENERLSNNLSYCVYCFHSVIFSRISDSDTVGHLLGIQVRVLPWNSEVPLSDPSGDFP